MKITLLLLLAISFLVSCEKETALKQDAGKSKTIIFNIAPEQDYSGNANQYAEIRLLIKRSTSTGDLAVWDTVFPKKLLKSFLPLEVKHTVAHTNASSGIFYGIYSIFYYTNDTFFWASSGSKQMPYNDTTFVIPVLF